MYGQKWFPTVLYKYPHALKLLRNPDLLLATNFIDRMSEWIQEENMIVISKYVLCVLI